MIIAVLIRPKGPTSMKLFHLFTNYDVYVPSFLIEELRKHLSYIAKKREESVEMVEKDLRILLLAINVIDPPPGFIKEALSLVNDHSDVPYVALALYLREKYNTVLLLTFNKKDYGEDGLRSKNIRVLSPDEL